MTNLWPAINNLRMEATRLRQTSRRAEAAEGMDIAASVLEAAGLLFPLFDLPEDDKWYRLTANIKRMKERPGITVDCPSIILESLPDAPGKE